MDKLKKDLGNAYKQYEDAKEKAYADYIERNALAKIGDIVSDERTPIKVTKIYYNSSSEKIVYYGACVTKDKNGYRCKVNGSMGYAFQNKNFKLLCKKEDF